MKPTLKDYLSIALALLAIFLCGYGIGFLLGERKGMANAPPPPPSPPPVAASSMAAWEHETLARLEQSIDLTPAQLVKVKAEISVSAARLGAAREGALATFREERVTLHERLKPHLTPEQWEKLRSPPSN